MITTEDGVATATLHRSHSALPVKASQTGLMALPAARFRILLLAIVAAAAAMAAEGVQAFAQMRARHYTAQARANAVSPVSYRSFLPTLHALLPGDGFRVVVRADSADADALCALSAVREGGDVRWIAFSPAVPDCLAGRIVRGGPAERREMGEARWLVMDGSGAALYSRREVPADRDVREIAAMLAPRDQAGR